MHYYQSRNADLELGGSSDGALFKLGAYGHLANQLWDFHLGEDAFFPRPIEADSVGRAVD